MADAGGGDRGPIADGHPGRLRDAIGRLPHHFVNAARPGPTLPTGPGRALTGACSDSPPSDPPERPSRSDAPPHPRNVIRRVSGCISGERCGGGPLPWGMVSLSHGVAGVFRGGVGVVILVVRRPGESIRRCRLVPRCAGRLRASQPTTARRHSTRTSSGPQRPSSRGAEATQFVRICCKDRDRAEARGENH